MEWESCDYDIVIVMVKRYMWTRRSKRHQNPDIKTVLNKTKSLAEFFQVRK